MALYQYSANGLRGDIVSCHMRPHRLKVLAVNGSRLQLTLCKAWFPKRMSNDILRRGGLRIKHHIRPDRKIFYVLPRLI